MGMRKSCYTNNDCKTIPNPQPDRWELIHKAEFKKAYVLKVKYLDCTNYEGMKILVFTGKYNDVKVNNQKYLDPHFDEEGNLIARLVPTQLGWTIACVIAHIYSKLS
jgi:hypothetical protein